MKNNEVILYKRKNNLLRFLSFFITILILIVAVIVLFDNLITDKSIVINLFIYFVIMLIITILLNKYTGYTNKIIVKYNDIGFSIYDDKDFIKWDDLKSWSIKSKVKYHNPSERGLFPKLSYFEWSILLGTSRINKLELILKDDKKIVFNDEEITDIKKFIKYLHQNLKEKCK